MKIFLMVLIDALLLLCMYLGFYLGMGWAENIALLVMWIFGLLGFVFALIAISKEVVAKEIQTKSKTYFVYNRLMDTILTLVVVAFGHFILAAIWTFFNLILISVYIKKDNR